MHEALTKPFATKTHMTHIRYTGHYDKEYTNYSMSSAPACLSLACPQARLDHEISKG